MKPYYDKNGITIYCGDCLEVMPQLEPPFNAIIADWPYGTTACSWDSVIPLEPLWKECKRLSSTAVLFGSQPFTTDLISSNRKWFKYCWVWEKTKPTNFINAKIMPLRGFEDICVFYNRQPAYNPQGIIRVNRIVKNTGTKSRRGSIRLDGDRTSAHNDIAGKTYKQKIANYPRGIIKFQQQEGVIVYHPTQKPEPLMAYLIRTYTNPGDIILDNTIGSGTTLLAAQNEGRRAVGIELDEEYCKIAVERLRQPSFFSIGQLRACQLKKPEARQIELTEMIDRGLE